MLFNPILLNKRIVGCSLTNFAGNKNQEILSSNFSFSLYFEASWEFVSCLNSAVKISKNTKRRHFFTVLFCFYLKPVERSRNVKIRVTIIHMSQKTISLIKAVEETENKSEPHRLHMSCCNEQVILNVNTCVFKPVSKSN